MKNASSELKRFLKDFKTSGLAAFKKMNKEEQKRIIDWSTGVTRQYLILIDKNLSNIKDIADMPYPKEDIKLAIKMMLPIK